MRMSRGRASSALSFADTSPHRALSTPSPHSCGTVPSAPPEIAEQAAYYGDCFFHDNIFWPPEHTARMVALYRERFEYHDHREVKKAIGGLGGQFFMRRNSQDAIGHSDAFLAGGQDRNDVA